MGGLVEFFFGEVMEGVSFEVIGRVSLVKEGVAIGRNKGWRNFGGVWSIGMR